MHKFVLTGKDPSPVEISQGYLSVLDECATAHEEADVVIVQQMVHIAVAKQGQCVIKIICDDTDVFLLLLPYYYYSSLDCTVLMEGTSTDHKMCDIRDTVQAHEHIIPDLLAAHALTGCNSTAYMWGLGKATTVKVLGKGYTLRKMGDTEADIYSVISEATRYVCPCYGFDGNLSEARYKLWVSKTGNRTVTRVPELKALPPISDAYEENVKRAHIQVCIWKHALNADPPNLDPTLYQCQKDETSKSLIPVTTPAGSKPAPLEILELIRCDCVSGEPCKTGRCGCLAAQLSCTVLCACVSNGQCCNKWSKKILWMMMQVMWKKSLAMKMIIRRRFCC